MYDEGQGMSQDYAAAALWFRKAAEQGDTRAQHDLGVMYYNGHGVPQDYVQAHMWLNLAATQGNSDAAKTRTTAAGKMTPDQITEAQKLAREWKPK